MTKKKRKVDILNLIRYGILVILVAYIWLLFAAKGSKDTSFDEVTQAVEKAADTANMAKASEREIRKFYGLTAEDYEEAVLYYTKETMSVEEILLIQSEDEEDLETIENAVEERRKDRIFDFEGYGSEQVKLLKDAIVSKKGDYILFVVSPEAGKIESAFAKSL